MMLAVGRLYVRCDVNVANQKETAARIARRFRENQRQYKPVSGCVEFTVGKIFRTLYISRGRLGKCVVLGKLRYISLEQEDT